jgi:general secretion pathway protein C
MGAAAITALLILGAMSVFRTPGPAESSDADLRDLRLETETAREPAPVAEDGDVPHTRLPLRLVATVLRENPGRSLATVENTARRGHQVLAEGQLFRDQRAVRIVSIERGRVLIDNDGVREQLVIDRTAPPLNARSRVAPPATPDGRTPTQSAPTRSLDAVGSSFDEGELSPVYEDGELIGIVLEDIRDGGLYEQVGLRNGDLVTSVNGVPLGEPTAAAEVLAELALSGRLTVEVEHEDGTHELLSVPTSELGEVFRGLE